MNTLELTPVGEIVNANFKSAEVFEKYGIDFCCKGKKSLQEACSEHNIDLNMITFELTDLFNTNTNFIARFKEWSLSFLVDYIVNNHHQYVRNANERLKYYTQKVAKVHGQRHPELVIIADLFEALADEMSHHMDKEEQILFPHIQRMELTKLKEMESDYNSFNTVSLPIQNLEIEHEQAGEIMAKIRELSSGYQTPNDACNTYKVCFAELLEYEKDLHQHVHLENNILFPGAIALENELNHTGPVCSIIL